MNAVKVYGADWCKDTQATLNNLDSLGVMFDYGNRDVDRRSEEWVKGVAAVREAESRGEAGYKSGDMECTL